MMKAIALYDYPGDSSNYILELQAGHTYIIKESQKDNNGWYQGYNAQDPNQSMGYIAENYIRVEHELEEEEESKENDESVMEIVVLLRDYKGNPDEHQIQACKGTKLRVVSRVEKSNWIYVESLTDGTKGYAPDAYVGPCESMDDVIEVLHSYSGDASQHQLLVQKGEQVSIIEAFENGWTSVLRLADGTVGYIPTSCISKHVVPVIKSDAKVARDVQDEPEVVATGIACKTKGCKYDVRTKQDVYCDSCANYIAFRQKVLNRPCTKIELQEGSIFHFEDSSISDSPDKVYIRNYMSQMLLGKYRMKGGY